MRIEYEDNEIIVVYKETGLPVQSGRTSGRDLVSVLKNHLAQESCSAGQAPDPRQAVRGAEPYLGIVHRLDQPVEGLLVFAKTPGAAAHLSRQAAAKGSADPDRQEAAKGSSSPGRQAAVKGNAGPGRQAGAKKGKKEVPAMEKIYRAVVLLDREAYPLALEGRKREILLTDWILRDYSGNTAMVVEEGVRDAKKAQLYFRTLEMKDGRAMVEIRLLTGRHHQIRVQMAHAHMPLAGDRKYGGGAGEDGRLCLCAARLCFTHPGSGRRMEFTVTPGFSL